MNDKPPPKNPRLRAWARALVVFIVAFDVAFAWQKLTGAYESEFGAHPDEAAHYVTGLFVKDAVVTTGGYVADGCKGSPVTMGKEYANNFYDHYPKVALGVWPPGFYLAQSAWTLPFGESRTSILILMAALAGLTATIIYQAIRRDFGEWPAIAAALLWLCGPLAREHYGMVMAETMSALTMLAATLLWARFLEEGRARDAVWFGVLASFAIMTKATALALVLMCGLSLLLTRRWKILARPALWAGVAIIIVLAGVWTFRFREEGLRVGGWEDNSGGLSWAFTRAAAPFYAKELALAIGYGVAAFGLIGILFTAAREPRWAALSSLVIGILVFQSLIPVGREARHIVAATPALVMLAIAGAFALARHRRLRAPTGREQGRREFLWVVLVVLLVIPTVIRGFSRKEWTGFEPLAQEILERAPDGARVLVCSDASGEGMLISEIAMRDRRPNIIIERASKTLVDPKNRNWGGRGLRERFGDDEDLLKYLLGGKIEYVVLDVSVPAEKISAYHEQLFRLVRDNSAVFWKVAESPVTRDSVSDTPPIRLFRILRDNTPKPTE